MKNTKFLIGDTTQQLFLAKIVIFLNYLYSIVTIQCVFSGPVPYYIVKNSWGEDFGHFGYIYIKAGSNVCGKANHYPSA